VRSAKLTTTIRTLERHECFFPALLALHVSRAPSMLKENKTVYTFPSRKLLSF